MMIDNAGPVHDGAAMPWRQDATGGATAVVN